ncbi:hypothetical protein CWE08_05995 [Aliidiomarina iranensis]|uniref:Uncharacterized protein n=1 Tax=Aliidiomarina iranensis TaxID=1434071 RepID=A0A432VWU1_9GAMM|nr:hypothetical protein [Aliidiomarina iranensis]RUO21142.1 hypothetical protein CWE08_05995 [Aliidiomarina iranensis]
MSGFSLFELTLVLGISAGIFAWQAQSWQVFELKKPLQHSVQNICTSSQGVTHRHQEENYWFSEKGELFCV